MEVACTDEVKVYKDEGEEEEQKKSSENLTEDKVGLVTEGEVQYSPKNAFNLGFLSLGEYYHSLFPLPFTRGASPYAVTAAAAAAAAAHHVHMSSSRSFFGTNELSDETALQQSACVRSQSLPSSKQPNKVAHNFNPISPSPPSTCRSPVNSFTFGSNLINSQRSGDPPSQPREAHLLTATPPLLPCLSGLHPSWGALMNNPLYDAAVHAAAATVAIGSPGNGTPFWPAALESKPRGFTQPKQFTSSETSHTSSSPSVVAVAAAAAAAFSHSPSSTAAAALHSELLMATNLYGLKATGIHKRPGSFFGDHSTDSSFVPPFGSSKCSPIPFLENWTGLTLNSSVTKDTKTNGSSPQQAHSSLAVAAAAMLRERLTNSSPHSKSNGIFAAAAAFDSSKVSLPTSSTSSTFSPSYVATDLSVPFSANQPEDFSVSSPSHSSIAPSDCSHRAAAAAVAATAAHVQLLSHLAAAAAAAQTPSPSPTSVENHRFSSSSIFIERSGTAEGLRESNLKISPSPSLSDSPNRRMESVPHANSVDQRLTPENGLDFSFADSNMPSVSSHSSELPVCTSLPAQSSCNSLRRNSSIKYTAHASSKTSSPIASLMRESDRQVIVSSIPTSVVLSTPTVGNTASGKRAHIKKPLNAFMLFMKDMRPRVQEECTLKESAAINQILGRKWHELSREKQAKYYELARKEKELHHQLFPGWSARDNYAMHSRRKKKRRLAALAAAQSATHRQSNTDSSDLTSTGDWVPGLKSGDVLQCASLSNSVHMVDVGNAKKCRARFGLEHQHRWCKPCRRKKKCIRFMTDLEFEETERRRSTSSSSSPPLPLMSRSRVHASSFPTSTSHCSGHQSFGGISGTGISPPHLSRNLDLWSTYTPNLPNCRLKRNPFASLDTVPSTDNISSSSLQGASISHLDSSQLACTSASSELMKSENGLTVRSQTPPTSTRVTRILDTAATLSSTQIKPLLTTQDSDLGSHAHFPSILSSSISPVTIFGALSSANTTGVTSVASRVGSTTPFELGNYS